MGRLGKVLAVGLSLDHFFNVNHEACIVSAKAPALRNEGTNSHSMCPIGRGVPWSLENQNGYLVHYLERMREVLISLDQSKLSDNVDRQYFVVVRTVTGFGPVLCGWIAAAYSISVVRVNGYVSEPFSIICSVYQGRPISSVLYVLAL